MLVIDMLNAYRHEDADKLAASVAEIIDPSPGSSRGRGNATTST